nr:MAG TPA_asm: hypothetical protein [Caudoviricetes sp.]
MNLDNIKSKLLEIFKLIINAPVLGILWATGSCPPEEEENKKLFAYVGNLLVLWVFIIACIVGLW